MVPVGGLEPPRPKATDFENLSWAFEQLDLLGYFWILKTINRDFVGSTLHTLSTESKSHIQTHLWTEVF